MFTLAFVTSLPYLMLRLQEDHAPTGAALGSGARRVGRPTTGTRIRRDAPENPPQRHHVLAL